MCREFHQMPEPGGMMVQDSLFIYGMNKVIEAQHKKDELDRIQRESKSPSG